MKMNPRILLSGLALTSWFLAQPAKAAVTVQGWWHYGEVGDYYGDSSGNGRRFGEAFSCAGGGNAGAGVTTSGCGGPLGTTGFTSTSSLYWTPLNCNNAGMWAPGSAAAGDPVYGGVAVYNPPATNYAIECWLLPDQNPGTGKFFMSGSTDFSQPTRDSGAGPGGVYFWRNSSTMQVGAFIVANASQGVATDTQIGDFATLDPTRWMHVAVVNNGGTNTFYVNGVQQGASTTLNTAPNGNIFAGCGEGTGGAYHGYLDELRISTFAPGAFSMSDLLLRPPGPSIVLQPQSATVWNGGAAPFSVTAAVDASITYQWQRLGTVFTNIPGATSATLYLPQVSLADSGAQFQCILTASSVSVTSAVATLTVSPNRTSDVSFYRAAVTAEPSLAGYFPVDGNLGSQVTNVVNMSVGTIDGSVSYDGRTNRAYGERALAFNGAGDVQILDSSAFQFGGGFGTIEALVYVAGTAQQDETIFAWAYDGGGSIGYALQASKDGSQLLYVNDTTNLSWVVPVNLIGRLAHVAVVIDNLTNVTAIVDGQSLGTKQQVGFGAAFGAQAWIGSLGSSSVKPFAGAIDELAVYGTNLLLNTLQVHYSRYVYGTNVSAPSIVSQSGPRSVLAGAAPLLKVQLAGTLPISYQWTSNGVPISGATASTLKAISAPGTVDYVLYATNAIGWTNSQPITITYVTPPTPYSAAVAAAHPLAYWRLDESSGTTAVDSAGYHDGTYSGTVVFGAPSVITTDTDKGVDFAGTGRVTVPNYPELNPAGAFSLEVWTRPHAGASGFIVASQNRSNSRGGYSLNGNFFFNEYEIDLGAPNSSVTRYDSSTLPTAEVPVHIVFAWDGVSPQGAIYVNGAKTATPQGGYTGDMLTFVNNTLQPLTMGIRYDGSGPWNGVVDEVAFYDYALSDAQVTNHWSFSWAAAVITSNPVGVTNIEGTTVSLAMSASGYPNTYQWYKQGSGALSATALNSDGTLHYPNGVTATTLTISQLTLADAGQYYGVAVNPLANATTVNASVGVIADTNPPTVTSVTGLGTPNTYTYGPSPYIVRVDFNKRIDPASGTLPANYVFTPSVTVNQVFVPSSPQASAFKGDWQSAFILTGGLTPGTKYSLTVSGVRDQAATPNTIVASTHSFFAPLLTSGVLQWDYYYPVTPQGVSSLYGTPNYPFGPDATASLTVFDTDQITGGDLNNNPLFGAAGDNYGDSLSGWITPTVSGDYYFFLASDDASQLWLSLDANPANATPIAAETSCCHGFLEPTNSVVTGGDTVTTITPITLTAGTSYFIQALHTEGGGGDFVKVAWRLSTDSTPAADLQPIPSEYLSSYAAVPAPKFTSTALSAGQMTIGWSGYQAVLQQSTDLKVWTNVTGNPNPLVINVSSAPQMFYRLMQ